jgi:hypothetical protein
MTHITYRFFFCLLLALSTTLSGYSQKSLSKWGKPSPDDLKLSVCFYDSAAPVIVLDEAGSVEIGFGAGGVYIKKYFKLKILNENGLDAGTIRLPFYVKDNFEVITDVKAHTLNVDENGKLTEHKVDSDQFFEVNTSDDWKETRFSFPAVKAGSILEYSYSLRSKSYTFLEGWVFQNPYPTLHSSFTAKIAEGLDYRLMYQGKELVEKYGSKENQNSWELYYLPALKDEPYLWNCNDYAEEIRFQLTGYKTFDAKDGVKDVTLLTSWKAIAKDVLESDSYTDYRNSARLSEQVMASAGVAGKTGGLAKAIAIYDYFLSTLKWDGTYRVFPVHPANKLFDYHEGSSADINLLLCSVMKNAGLDARLMLVSTRENGAIFRECEVLTQFNSVIVYLKLEGKEYYVDATDKNRPFNLPPFQLLNTSGYCLDKNEPFWVEINSPQKSKSASLIDLFVSNNDTTNFTIEMRFDDYLALKYRDMLDNKGQRETVETILGVPNASATLESTQIVNKDTLSLPLIIKMHGWSTNLANHTGSIIYFSPLIIPRQYKNPFTAERRVYPVNFDYVESAMCSLKVNFTDELLIDNVPLPANLTIPGKSVSFVYNFTIMDKVIAITTKFVINEVIIPARNYAELKQLYGTSLEKLSEPIVFKIKH